MVSSLKSTATSARKRRVKRTNIEGGHSFAVTMQDEPDEELEIPQAFIAKHPKFLNRVVYVSVHKGPLHIVHLTGSRKKPKLGSTWEDFVELYNIREGYTLMFECTSTKDITVKIFDSSGCELNYSLMHTPRTKQT